MNRPSLHKLPDQLSLDDLRAYQADQLSGPARHRVERLMLENPFYADALDGLDALQQVGGSLKSQTRDLHLALQERVHESATTRRLMPLWVTSLAASVLLVLAVSIYLIFNTAQRQKQAARVVTGQIEPGTVLIDPKDLGTSAATVDAPDVLLERANGKPVTTSVPSRKVARKSHRASSKRTPLVVEELPDAITGDCTPPVMMDEPPVSLRVSVNVPNRHVNTERAFNDWPPSAKTISRW